MYDKVVFKPWVGKGYQNGGMFGKKILVLGDSHYCDNCNECGVDGNVNLEEMETCRNFTINTMNYYLDPDKKRCGWTRTFKKFERALSGNLNTDFSDSKAIWDSVAFYNFIQTANHYGPREPYPNEIYISSIPYFFDVLKELNPDFVFVWGNKVWDSLPAEGWEYNKPIDGYKEIGKYNIDGKDIKFLKIQHPSSPTFSYECWEHIIREFIER